MRRKTFAGAAAMAACAAAVVACFGCSHMVASSVDKRINETLPRYFGPADRYETHIDIASTGALMRGRVRSVQIVGEEVRLRPDLTLRRIELDAQAVEIDPKRHTLEGVGSAAFTGTATADEINRYVRDRVKDVPGLRIDISGDKVTVHANPDALGIIRVPVTVRGTLEPVASGDHLDFVPDRGAVSIIPVPRRVLEYLARKVNPIVDLTKLPIEIHVDRVSIADGAITMSGTVPPDALLKADLP